MGNVQGPSNTSVRPAGRSVNAATGAGDDPDRCGLKRILQRSDALPPGLHHNPRVDTVAHVTEHFIATIQNAPAARIGYTVERLARRALAENRRGLSSSRPGLLARKTTPFQRHMATGLTAARRPDCESESSAASGVKVRRAVLPRIAQHMVQQNEIVASAMASGVAIDGLAVSIADRMTDGGKFGYIEVSDFMSVLSKVAPIQWRILRSDVACRLYGLPARRFGKLVRREPVNEADFAEAYDG